MAAPVAPVSHRQVEVRSVADHLHSSPINSSRTAVEKDQDLYHSHPKALSLSPRVHTHNTKGCEIGGTESEKGKGSGKKNETNFHPLSLVANQIFDTV